MLVHIFVEIMIKLFQDSLMNRKFKRTEFIWNRNPTLDNIINAAESKWLTKNYWLVVYIKGEEPHFNQTAFAK